MTRNHTTLSRGMTLMELMLVLVLMAVVMGIVGPSLSKFFAGRGVDGQSKRLFELTQYAKSQAIATGIPMRIWIKPETGEYGVSAREGYEFEDTKPVLWKLEDSQKFDLGEQDLDKEGKAGIVFTPDGLIEDGAIDVIVLEGKDKNPISVRRAASGTKYEIVDGAAKGVDHSDTDSTADTITGNTDQW